MVDGVPPPTPSPFPLSSNRGWVSRQYPSVHRAGWLSDLKPKFWIQNGEDADGGDSMEMVTVGKDGDSVADSPFGFQADMMIRLSVGLFLILSMT